MKNQITKIENTSDTQIRLTFTDGTTLRMSRKSYENGSWKNGTTLSLVREIQG